MSEARRHEPQGTSPPRLRIGRIVRPHGLRGEVVVRATALSPEEFAALGEVRLVRDGVPGERRVKVSSARGGGEALLVLFEGTADVDAAAELRGAWIEAERSAMPDAGEGQIYYYDLLGLDVIDESGRVLGTVRRVLPTGANEVLEIDGPAGELLLPYHAETVIEWKPESRQLRVRLPAGLEEIYERPEPRPKPGGSRP